MDLTMAFRYAAAVVVVLLMMQVLTRPVCLLLKALRNSIIGGVVLWLINLVLGPLGLHVALNPASAAIVGLLGFPGIACLATVRVLLR